MLNIYNILFNTINYILKFYNLYIIYICIIETQIGINLLSYDFFSFLFFSEIKN